MDQNFVTFDSFEVRKCRSRCYKTCCINCGNFLSADREKGEPDMLFGVHCHALLDASFNMRTGANACKFHIIAWGSFA